jgi:ChrR Cupin-like domain
MPEVIFRHVDDLPWREVRAQQHGDRRVAVNLRFLEMSPTRTVIYTRYDPGMVLERHGHASDHVVFVLEGSLRVGDRDCPAGTMVLLEHGAAFGPLEAGPDGTLLLEFYTGDPSPVPSDPDGFEALLQSRGITPIITGLDGER